MPQIVPLTNSPSSKFVITLDGNKLNFQTKYNTRLKIWTFDIYDSSFNPIVYGVPFVLGSDILSPYTAGIGGLIPLDLTESGAEATPESIGVTTILVHLSEDELEELRLSGSL